MIKNIMALACAALLAGPAFASTQLLTNGGFETGDYTGWTASTFAGSSGTIVATDAAVSPVSAQSVAGATEGTYHVLTGQSGPGAYAVSQDFLAPVDATSLLLSFVFFSASTAGLFDGGLDPFCCGSTQNARVDVLSFGSDVFSNAGVVHSIVAPVITGNFGTPYQSYALDLLPFLSAGSNYTLRFAQADNGGIMTMGVDNVSLVAETSAVPVPASGLLLVGAVGGIAALRRRKRQAA